MFAHVLNYFNGERLGEVQQGTQEGPAELEVVASHGNPVTELGVREEQRRTGVDGEDFPNLIEDVPHYEIAYLEEKKTLDKVSGTGGIPLGEASTCAYLSPSPLSTEVTPDVIVETSPLSSIVNVR